jgi:hypothetical protein
MMLGDELALVRCEIEADAVLEDERIQMNQSSAKNVISAAEGRSTRRGSTRSGMIARARAIISHAVCRSNRSSAS